MSTSYPKKKRTGSQRLSKSDKPQRKHRLETVSNNLLEELNPFYVITTLALGSPVVHKHRSYSVRVKDAYSSMHQNSKHMNQDTTVMKQDEYSAATPTLKRWIKRSPTAESRWARPKTVHQAQTNLIERF